MALKNYTVYIFAVIVAIFRSICYYLFCSQFDKKVSYMTRRHRIDHERSRDILDRFGEVKGRFTKRQRFVLLDNEARESGAVKPLRRSARHSVRRQLNATTKAPYTEPDIHADREFHIFSRAAGTL